MIIKGMSNSKIKEAKSAIESVIKRKGISLKAIALEALILSEVAKKNVI